MIALAVLSATGMRLHAAESSSADAAEPSSAAAESSSAAVAEPSSPAAESSSSAVVEPSPAAAQSPSSAGAPAVKLSRDGICHDAASQYYSKLKEYQGFDSMNSCIAAGGQQRSTAK